MTVPTFHETPPQLGCPLCGYVFTNDVACPECHRRQCRCKPQMATLPVITQATMDPRARIGYCPSCGQRTHLLTDVHQAVTLARTAYLQRQRRGHLAGHRGRETTSCPYCRGGNPLGRLLQGEPTK